jgi:alanine dehydrogenase
VVCVSDYNTGVPLAILDGNAITELRTAAVSAAAAWYLAPNHPRAIGLVGCGAQARAHLDAFAALFPSLREVHLFSRSPRSLEALANVAQSQSLAAVAHTDSNDLLAACEIVVSSVPNSPGLKPFLDATRLPDPAFVSAIDMGWSWIAETLGAFDRRYTDSLQQTPFPLRIDGKPVESAGFHDDLIHLTSDDVVKTRSGRTLFAFRGFAIADLVISDLIIKKARERGLGIALKR